MKSLVILCLIGFATASLSTNADKSVDSPCPPKNFFSEESAESCCVDVANCKKDATSKIVDEQNINKYDNFMKHTNEYLVRSYEYFFLSAQFGTYGKDRPGFQKLLKGLSDSAWNKGIQLIKEITKRGHAHTFQMDLAVEAITSSSNVTELVALAKAAEIEKGFLVKANDLHRHHSHASFKAENSCGYDAALSHFIAEEILEEKTETVRTLVGHVNQLKKLFVNDKATYPLSLFMFDQHLQ
jgi:hypothetical protein